MHLSSILIGAVGFAGIAFAAPDAPAPTPKPDCTHTVTFKWTHGLTAVVKQYSEWKTQSMTVDCHGCNSVVQQTLYIKNGGGYSNRAARVRVVAAPTGVVGTKRIYVCRSTDAAPPPPAEKPAIQAKPIPSRLTWGGSKGAAKDVPAKKAPANDAT
ncbi:hypothetical protein TWF569_007329 [Orbilia oligospora]|uniref:Uncharacterized protein n=1 Tax=Orbilia oligospora TaxID=2813651 RepID=A0A7C8NYJ5_ORBOL|nr:hypothetical protein TWF706_006284 [Orbilia oligospora]KAF3108632.1 hypothetical protein TWF102_010755 [Orbilia oligospora]KAF3111536.1 hypothetical protein TWF103_003485 [Orbilia oligospora]KAF3136104.1 hypothetical protein TWF703_005749 [Orbilia oligospora]KAF3143235.1 hypothetical protein TWF569_007329 [Orbilia oligospora]